MCGPAFPSDPKASARERAYQGEEDHRTLSRAAEIQSDSSRMSGVRAHHRKASRKLASVGRTLKRAR